MTRDCYSAETLALDTGVQLESLVLLRQVFSWKDWCSRDRCLVGTLSALETSVHLENCPKTCAKNFLCFPPGLMKLRRLLSVHHFQLGK